VVKEVIVLVILLMVVEVTGMTVVEKEVMTVV